MRDIFKKIITDFHEKRLPSTVSRNVDIPIGSGKIISLVGVRRSGKTSLLYVSVRPTHLATGSGTGYNVSAR